MVHLKVQEVAEQKGFSMGKLQRSADVAYRTLKLIYKNPTRDVNVSTLEKLARALGVSICELIEELPDEEIAMRG